MTGAELGLLIKIGWHAFSAYDVRTKKRQKALRTRDELKKKLADLKAQKKHHSNLPGGTTG